MSHRATLHLISFLIAFTICGQSAGSYEIVWNTIDDGGRTSSGVFDGNALWLEIGVRPGNLNDPNVYTVLSPRQEVTPTHCALLCKNIISFWRSVK